MEPTKTYAIGKTITLATINRAALALGRATIPMEGAKTCFDVTC